MKRLIAALLGAALSGWTKLQILSVKVYANKVIRNKILLEQH